MRDDVLQQRIIHLSREHGALVHGVARRYAHTAADLEDLVQDVWVRVVEILPRKNPASPDPRWLCVVAANVGYEFWKRRKRQARVKEFLRFLPRDGEAIAPSAPAMGDTPAARIWAAIDALPELQRQVVLHRVIEGLSTDETARTINRAEGTVKVSLHRALKTLSVELADLEALWSSSDL
jgi:RNA polymerase sigma-70 factor (ECF subfamily)